MNNPCTKVWVQMSAVHRWKLCWCILLLCKCICVSLYLCACFYLCLNVPTVFIASSLNRLCSAKSTVNLCFEQWLAIPMIKCLLFFSYSVWIYGFILDVACTGEYLAPYIEWNSTDFNNKNKQENGLQSNLKSLAASHSN